MARERGIIICKHSITRRARLASPPTKRTDSSCRAAAAGGGGPIQRLISNSLSFRLPPPFFYSLFHCFCFTSISFIFSFLLVFCFLPPFSLFFFSIFYHNISTHFFLPSPLFSFLSIFLFISSPFLFVPFFLFFLACVHSRFRFHDTGIFISHFVFFQHFYLFSFHSLSLRPLCFSFFRYCMCVGCISHVH